MEWLESKQIKITPPKRPKKLTGTRFAAIFGLNKWSTPFEIWCEVTRTYEKPFEDTIYTIAGKTIEPKQIEYMKKAYVMTDLATPTDIFGANYFNKTYGDFFHEDEVFGGMWDSIRQVDGKPVAVLEFKTTKRAEDWADDIPEYYALQAALYAYLLGVDKVIMVCSFLEEKDYEAPEAFVPTPKNTIVIPFSMSERYPAFEEEYIRSALAWWEAYVVTGISPVYDEKEDADILKVLRNNNLNPESDIRLIINEAETLKGKIEGVEASIKADSDRLKVLTEQIRQYALSQFRDGDNKVTLEGAKYTFSLSKSESSKINKQALEADGLLDKYSLSEVSYRFTQTPIKENKKNG